MTFKFSELDLYFVLDNQKASKNTFQATTFKVEENSRTFQGLPLKFKDFSRLCEPWIMHRIVPGL